MKKQLKQLFLKTVLAVGSALLIAAPFTPIATAQVDCTVPANKNNSICAACEGVKAAGGNCNDPATQKSFNETVTDIVNILSIVVGAVCVIMIIIGGFRYVVSAGDSNGIQGAKNTILYALVGLVVVIFARTIVVFILTQLANNGGATPAP